MQQVSSPASPTNSLLAMAKTLPVFMGTCVGLHANDLHDYDDSSRNISYQTFRKHLGKKVMNEINAWAGWPGTHFSRDRHISYSKGRWKGRKAVCMMHSSIHHIWTI